MGLRSGGGLLGFVVVGNSVGGKDGSSAVQWGAAGGETALGLFLPVEPSWRSLGDSRTGVLSLHGFVTALMKFKEGVQALWDVLGLFCGVGSFLVCTEADSEDLHFKLV